MNFTFNKQRENTPDLTKLLQPNPEIDITDTCQSCPLLEQHTPIEVMGTGKKKVLVVFSHPTKKEQEAGRLYSSHSFIKVANDLGRVGLDIHKDCWYLPATRCYPGANVPSKKMLDCCRGNLLKTVRELKPTTVVLVGRNATYGWIGHQFSIPPREFDKEDYLHDAGFDTWVGHAIPDHTYAFEVGGKKVCPTVIPIFNPEDVSKMEKSNRRSNKVDSVLPFRYYALLHMIADFVGKKIGGRVEDYAAYNEDPGGAVKKIWDAKEAIRVLRELNTPSIIAFDYETNSLSGANPESRILMVGISNGEASYAIPFFAHIPEFMQAYKELMTNPEVKKIAHNAKFEYNWTRYICGYRIEGLLWDTMLVAHILDMRDGTTGLKFRSYTELGLAGYEKVTKKLLSSPDKATQGKNALNWLQYLYADDFSINTKVWDLLLTYVGKDAGNTRALYLKQVEELLQSDYKHLMKGINLFQRTTIAFAEMERNGFRFDMDKCRENKELIKKEMEEIKKQMENCEEYQKWKAVHPDKPLNSNSSKQLQEFFFDILGYTPTRFTKSGAPSTDKEAKEDIDSEYTNLSLKYSALDKMLNSFLIGYERETSPDGQLRCDFNLNVAKSYRTSSSNPNLQNVSHHSDISHYALELFKPMKGHVLINADFSALEVSGAACHTQDRQLIEYLHNPDADMHADFTRDIFMMSPDEPVDKTVRSVSKTGVFSTFYSASAKSTAHTLWKKYPAEAKALLAEKGIKNYPMFEAHMQKIISDFWNVRFKQYGAWKVNQWNDYVKTGYFKGHTGFIYNGILNSRQTSNLSVQGDSSHILCDMCTWLHDDIQKGGWDVLPCSQVHDSWTASSAAEDVPKVLESIRSFLAILAERHPWTKGINFKVEVELSEIDGSWNSVMPVALVRGSGVELFEPSVKIDDEEINFGPMPTPLDVVNVTKLAEKNKHAFVSKTQYRKLILDLAGVKIA